MSKRHIGHEEYALSCLAEEEAAINAARPRREYSRKAILRDKAKAGEKRLSQERHLKMSRQVTDEVWGCHSFSQLNAEKSAFMQEKEAKSLFRRSNEDRRASKVLEALRIFNEMPEETLLALGYKRI